MNKIYYWSEEDDNLLKKLYTDKKSKQEVLNSFPNRSYGAIKHRARTLNIKKTRLQYKNENFFNIPNITNCSIAGMIASDGNIKKPQGRGGYVVTFGISTKDKIILEDIIKSANSNAIIRDIKVTKAIKNERFNGEIKDYFASYVYFSSAKKWANDLQKHWNITENKSLTLTAPNITDLDLSLAYILGIINGDGSIGIQRTDGNRYFYMRLLGTRNLLEWIKNRFQEYLKQNIGGDIQLERPNAKVYHLQINGAQAIKLFEKMNSLPDVIKLARKWSNPEILEVISAYKLKFPHLFLEN